MFTFKMKMGLVNWKDKSNEVQWVWRSGGNLVIKKGPVSSFVNRLRAGLYSFWKNENKGFFC